MRKRQRGRTVAAGQALLTTLFCLGCSHGGAGALSPDQQALVRDVTIEHEECDVSAAGAEKLDVNGDGKPDITVVRSGGRDVCRAYDLNFDGRVDLYAYYDSAGKLRRKEYDFDRDGKTDEIALYSGGVITERQRATVLAGRLDTWQHYQNGALAKAERDSDSDAVVDQWWEYPQPGCPVIHTDTNHDGRPDPGTTIDYCKETGYVPPERQYFRQAEGPSFEQQSNAPTEVENKPEGDAAGSDKPKEGQ
jgi:hypothetical protein